MIEINNEATIYTIGECAFFMRSRDRYGKLSNMTGGFPLEANQIMFQGPEGLYQALKFPHDPVFQIQIAGARSGMDAKRLAYTHSDVTPEWDGIRLQAMALTLTIKLAQFPDEFGDELLSTGNLPIVEKSNRDAFWGARPYPEQNALVGINALGQLLTQLRDSINAQGGNRNKAAAEFSRGISMDGLSVRGLPLRTILFAQSGSRD